MIFGAGISGLALGWSSGLPIYEAEEVPGGICLSYYMRPKDLTRLHQTPEDGEAYRFEIGGGHWIFGDNSLIIRFIDSLAPLKSYARRSAIYFPDRKLFVPYPIQHHLSYLGKDIAVRALKEMLVEPKKNASTMQEWLNVTFGETLTELFFGPFHELYTAGLWKQVAPQDPYKSPVSPVLAIQGAFDHTEAVGYNARFVYPADGLDALVMKMAAKCDVRYGKRIVRIDLGKKEVFFEDGSGSRFEILISTLPLNKVLKMAEIELDEPPDPYTSVLVLNIGAERGAECPEEHWVYLPQSRSGFHRVGFYSNVDVTFLPTSGRSDRSRVSIYVEKAFQGGNCPRPDEVKAYKEKVVKELREWRWIGNVEVVDHTWIDVAYTWSFPGSKWRQKALKFLEGKGIYQIGRYGRWVFQGIADSIRDGLLAGVVLG